MQGSLRGHATRLVLSLIAVAGAFSLAGCHGDLVPSDIPIPRETITFTYKFAEQRQPDVYHVQVLRGAIADPLPCGNQVEDLMRLEQIAFSTQRLAYPSPVNACAERFSVDMANARAADPHFAEVEFHRLQGTSDRRAHLIANNALAGDSYPTPSKIQIELNSAVLEGVRTTDGFAEISFDASGPIYRCEGSPGEDF